MIDQPTIDRILDAAQIYDVVSDFVTLRKRGVNYVGLCPFHDDKTPSFYVSPAKGLCKCFACGKGGNAVHFIMEHEQMSYPEALKYPPSDEPVNVLMSRARELKAGIRALGSVNVNAVDEYKETKERYEFLSKQKNDIIDAEEKLKNIIKDLSQLMEKQFREKLEIISENFSEVFREMFGGGRAYLKILDEDDVLGSGIDIIAQPPGKIFRI